MTCAKGVLLSAGWIGEEHAAPVDSKGLCARCDAYLGEASYDYLKRQSNAVRMEKT